MRPARWPFALLALVALVACQQAPSPPVIASLTANPPLIDQGATSTLQWSVTGTATLTLQPGVGDVTGLTQAVVSPATTTTYTLTAANTGGSDSAQVTVSVDEGIDVHGVVLGLDGRPMAGVDVVVPGGDDDTTNYAGAFTLEGIDAPYDIHLLHPTEPLVVTYLGLTRDDPVLLMSGGQTAALHLASIYGVVSAGTGYPQPANHVTRISYASPATRSTVDAAPATGGYEIVGIPWFGADVDGALHALQWQYDGSGLPVTFIGHGYRPLTLRAAIIGYLAQDMALLPVGEASVSGTVAVPVGYDLLSRTASVVYPEGGWVTTVAETNPGSPFSYVTPAIPDATIAIAAGAQAPTNELAIAMKVGLATDASDVEIFVPYAPSLDAPADSATDVGYATPFTWSTASSTVAVVLFNGPAGTLSHAVVTDDTTVTIPDLRDLGLDLVPAGTYHWQVLTMPEYATVDAAAGDHEDGFLSSWVLNAFYNPKHDGALASSLQRQFTTAP